MSRPQTTSYADTLTGAPSGRPRDPDATTAPSLPELSGEIDARVCSLHRIADSLREVVEGTRQESPIFNLSMFETRASSIAILRHLHTELLKLTAMVAKTGAAAESLHRAEIKAAQEGLSRAQTRAGDAARGALSTLVTPAEPAWAPPDSGANAAANVAANVAGAKVAWSKVASAPVPRPVVAPAAPGRRAVNVVGDLAVEAVVLPATLKTAPEVFAAINSGDLYYVPHWKHFAVRVGGCVLHANLGRIYRGAPPRSAGPVAREVPECVKECRRARCPGGAGCRYYHDPEDYADSTDVRNFMADSWLYTPAASPARYGTRRIGSSSDIEADIRAIGVEEARRFIHQTAHDVLCAAILWQHVIVPAQRQKGNPDTPARGSRR